MSIAVTHTWKRYTFEVDAPEGEPFVIEKNEEKVAIKRIVFEVITDASSTLRKVGVTFSAQGYTMRADGTLTRAKRLLQGSNLTRVPVEVRLALQEGIREAVGTLHDPLGQLDGYDGR